MTRRFVRAAVAMMLVFAVPVAFGQGRKELEKGGGKSSPGSKPEHKAEGKPGEKKPEHKPEEKPGKPEEKPGKANANSPGGDWSERTHGGKQSNENNPAAGAAAAAEKNKSPQASGAQGAAAGAAAANRNSPPVSGAAGAAAGAAAEKNKTPQVSGVQGAAAGAAAANRNSPAASGAAGAAAGVAAEKNRTPQVSGAQGAALGAAAAEHNTPAVSGAAGYAAVRSSFNHPNMYGEQWYGAHPGAWSPVGWNAGRAWSPVTWNAVALYGGYGNITPISYNYGGNVNYQNGNVMVDDTNVGTAVQFSQQAADLAQSGINAELSDNEQWLPLGVFALVRNENQHPQVILQFAINKQGILRGNYTDDVAGHTFPLQGAVDKQTQRAAWTVNGNMQSVMEAGLHNLTESEAPVLIHKNGKTSHWLLVRLEQPKAE